MQSSDTCRKVLLRSGFVVMNQITQQCSHISVIGVITLRPPGLVGAGSGGGRCQAAACTRRHVGAGHHHGIASTAGRVAAAGKYHTRELGCAWPEVPSGVRLLSAAGVGDVQLTFRPSFLVLLSDTNVSHVVPLSA